MVDRRDALGDEPYFDRPKQRGQRGFDETLLRESVQSLPIRAPICFSGEDPVSDAMRAMQDEHCGCVVITQDGTPESTLLGIFTERDVLLRIVGRGKNPATLPLADIMTRDPEALSLKSSIALALNMMSVGGFRHLPVVDESHRPSFVLSVRDVVEFLVGYFPREILNLPMSGDKSTKAREGA
ncbi:CBS domain-containing protein [Myxococcota bacterium]|nr:CBS domain-containing protein [Myxococcota bacterium]